MTDGGGVELHWPGKFDASGKRTQFEPPDIAFDVWERHGTGTAMGELVLGDNVAAMHRWHQAHPDGIDLVYMDPPFMTGSRFQARRKLGDDGGAHANGSIELPAYDDRWASPAEFLSMLDARVSWSHRLLADHGALYVHLDPTMGHAVKLLLDEVFGTENFQREIIWRIGWVSGFKSRVRNWVRNHDSIFFFAKNASRLHFERQFVPYPKGYKRRNGKPSDNPGIPMDDVWNASAAEAALSGNASLDSIQIKSLSREKTGWATQKNESLIDRIVLASSREGGWVADPFLGSGTTAAVAARRRRHFLGAEVAPLGLSLARARLLELGASFVVVGDRRALITAPGDETPCVRLQVTDDGEVRLLEVQSASAKRNVGDDSTRGPCWSVQSWCVLDRERRVLARSHRGMHGDNALGVKLSASQGQPHTVRIYGIFGEIIEVAIHRLRKTERGRGLVPSEAIRVTPADVGSQLRV